MTDRSNKQYKLSLIYFWINFIALSLVFIGVLYAKGDHVGVNDATNVALERYVIIITLASIPLALKLFHSRIKKIETLDNDVYFKKLNNITVLRIIILDIVTVMNIAAFHFYGNQNYIFLTIVVLFSLLFCYPNKSLLIRETENIEK